MTDDQPTTTRRTLLGAGAVTGVVTGVTSSAALARRIDRSTEVGHRATRPGDGYGQGQYGDGDYGGAP